MADTKAYKEACTRASATLRKLMEIEMKTENLSDNALRLWMCFFPTAKSTLSFGGDHAEMEITEDARKALNELLEIGAAEVSEPTDSWPNREHYKGGDFRLSDELRKRPHLNPFKDKVEFISFTKKAT